MTNNNFTPQQKEMLLKAQQVIDEAAKDYGTILKQHIQDLNESLDAEKLSEAIKICHLIQSQAGTFDWQLATEVSGWFKRLLKTQQEKGLNLKVNTVFRNSLDIILRDQLKGESEAAVKLLMHIEAVLKTEDIH